MSSAGVLDRSRRHREVTRPNGFGDELRVVLADDTAVWGALTLLRGADCSNFTPAESAVIAGVSSALAEGLRRAMVLSAEPPAEALNGCGVAVVAPDNSIVTADAAAEGWLAELRDTGPDADLPRVVAAVATQARGIVANRADADAVARARVRAPPAAGCSSAVPCSAMTPPQTSP